MLKGTIKFRDLMKGETVYDVYAQDSFESLSMQLTPSEPGNYTMCLKSNLMFDQLVELLPSETLKNADGTPKLVPQAVTQYADVEKQSKRRLDIQKANKYKTNITNQDMASKISAIIRYVQINGKKNYNSNMSDMIVNPEQYFEPTRIVNIQDTDGNEMGYVKFDTGLITECNIRSKFVDIQFYTINTPNDAKGIFKALKQKDAYGNILSATPISTYGFALNIHNLGFDYQPPVVREVANVLGMYETIEDVLLAHPDKDASWILERNYVIVTDDNLDEVMEYFYSLKRPIAFDTETTGLNITFKSRTGEADELVGVVLSGKTGEGYYFPLQHKLFPNLLNGDHNLFMEKYMKELLETRDIICHNIQYDWKVAYIYNIVVNCTFDTMLAFGVTKRYEDSTYRIGLKALTKNLFGIDSFDLGDFVTGSFGDSNITFADLPYEIVRHYAPADTDWTYALYDYVKHHKMLENYGATQVFELEVTFAMCVAYSEFYGYHIDTEKVPEMREEIVGNMEKYKQEMFDIAGEEFNPNSPPQLMSVMFDKLGIEEVGKKRSTNKETLKVLSSIEDGNGGPKYPFVIALKNYRKNEGIFKNFLKRLHEFSTPDGFIFPEVQQLGTDTGRSSVKNPNYQSYNDPVKRTIVPRQDHLHFDSDFSQIEYRVLCSMAQQESLMVAFDDPDLDYHTYQASRMFSIPYALVSKTLRSQSKGVNFGLPYGMGDASLGANIFGERNDENTKKAAALRKKFFEGQEKIEKFFEVTRANGVANNYTSTYWGRRRYYNPAKFNEAQIRRQAGNHVIQGTAADIYKIACNRLFKRCIAEGWLGKVLFNVFVHDEVLVEVHKSINMYYFFKAWREEFQLKIDGFCKLFAGAGVGMSWYEAKKQDLPPQYLERIINTWTPEMDWHEDVQKFIDDSNIGHEQYKDDRIVEYCTDEENADKVVKPIINSLLVEKTQEVVDEVFKIADAQERAERIAKINASVGYDLLVDSEDKSKRKDKVKKLSDLITIYRQEKEVEQEFVTLLSAEDVEVTQKSDEPVENPQLEFQDYQYSLEDLINLRGYHLDEDNGKLYMKDIQFNYDGFNINLSTFIVNKGLVANEGRYQLVVYDDKTRQFTAFNAYTSPKGYDEVMRIHTRMQSFSLGFQQVRW